MARTFSQIKAQMIATKQSQTTLSGLTSTSQTSTYGLLFFIPAVGIALLEQLMDIFKINTEATVKTAISPSAAWLQKKVFEFQYSATVQQIITINNFSPSYAVIDPTLQIISRCSVVTTAQRIVTIKVATGSPPTALSAPQLASLNSYLTKGGDGTLAGAGTGISYAGVQANAVSFLPDRLFLEGTITYNGQYAAVISASVIAAVNNYLSLIPFDGNVKILSLTDAIQAVPGVTDIKLKFVGMRALSVAFANKTLLIDTYTEVFTLYPTFAGYIIQEDTAGQTFTDKLTFVAS